MRSQPAPPIPCSTPAPANYDVAICAYHDQALIPIKTLDFDGGVNVTLGLPFIAPRPIMAPDTISRKASPTRKA